MSTEINASKDGEQSLKQQLLVQEIFFSIQGESTRSGVPTVFVRLTGCPLRCTYCDTTYAYQGGQRMSVEAVMGAVQKYKTQYICLTGGEPLVQKSALSLVQRLHEKGYEVSIETDGEEDVRPYVSFAKIIMDIKTPGSGERASRCFLNIPFLKPKDEVKFVICSREDFEWSVRILKEYDLSNRAQILFSPCQGLVELRTLAEWILEDQLPVRLQCQLHKIIWGSDAKGK